jgi:hypothetical protein
VPTFSEWLRASWADFRRRWGVLLAVAGTGGAVTLLAVFVPLFAALLATLSGLRSPAVWGAATLVALLAGLWLSTWAQAAMVLAAHGDAPSSECLSRAWRLTPAFAWTLTLVLAAVGGGWFLLLVPGMVLSVLLFSAPFYEASGEASGLRALELSWARVRPRFGATASRLAAAGILTAAPGFVPWVGWIVMLFWSPFGMAATARLAEDLRAADPAPAEVPRLGPAVAALTGVLLAGTLAASWLAVRATRAAIAMAGGPQGLAGALSPRDVANLRDLLRQAGVPEIQP